MTRADAIGFFTILRKEYIRIVRIWSQTLLPPVMNVALYLLIFGSFIGKRIGMMGNDSYASFIVPGLILMAVITNSYGNVSSSFFSAKFQKNIEEILVSPVPDWLIVLGFAFGGIIRGALVAAAVIAVILVAPGVELKVAHPLLAITILILTAGFFSLAGLMNAMFAKKFDDISFVPTFVLTPLTYLGGIFYPLSGLPEFWQKVSAANPILHMVSALRYAFLGHSDVSYVFALLFLIAGNAALYYVCLRYLKKGLGIRN
ncbi:ABC transporter permease [Turneriella parva]|uniref:Transport permease protein n=1 Tax=Turneriella parva (strain ATCC BAA-1111 / DSM 21527 / NCTC 11395 / H) TaxID=869212 RepID=I4BAX8_TURPD|nr:ABC transporter permease [Turneriella parva]AFM14435.1 ABC-2 type transporter [Turneriella parva DSM 21527]